MWSTVSEPLALSPRRQHDEQKRRPLAGEPSVRAAMSCRSARGVDRHPTQRIMIPADFGLAIGGSAPGNGRSASTRARRICRRPGPGWRSSSTSRSTSCASSASTATSSGWTRRSSAPSGIRGRSLSRGRCLTSPIRTTCSHRERRWRSSRRDTIWSGSNRASAAPERFGEFRARCREELAGQADKLNELCARERPRVRRPSSTARATESTTTPRSSPSCQAIADGTDRQRPRTSRARRAGSRGSRAARGRSRRTT